jgi:hypothetical protein
MAAILHNYAYRLFWLPRAAPSYVDLLDKSGNDYRHQVAVRLGSLLLISASVRPSCKASINVSGDV